MCSTRSGCHSRDKTQAPALASGSGKERPAASKTQASFFSNITHFSFSERVNPAEVKYEKKKKKVKKKKSALKSAG